MLVGWWWCDDDDDDDDAVAATSAALRAGFVDGPVPGNPLEVVVCSSSEVHGLGGRLRRSEDDVSSESTANERNSADLLLTHKVHLYSTKRVR